MTHSSRDHTPDKGDDVVEPARHLRWTVCFCLAWGGVMVGLYGPIQILLPDQAAAVDAAHKEVVLAWVLGAGALCALVTNPLWGALSDRTVSRHGMRLPWIVLGALVGALGLLLLAAARTVPAMILAWCLVQTALNAPWAALAAALPDHVPPHRRGAVAGWFGLAQILGILVATGLATVTRDAAGYTACAFVMVLAVAPYVVLGRDVVLPPASRPPWRFLVNPVRHGDFGWAWLTRFLLTLGNAVVLTYLLYFLRDGLGVATAEYGVLVLTLVDVLGMTVAVVVSGAWSDRLGRRKVFVSAAGLLMAGASFLVAGASTWAVTVVAAVLLGIGFGAYTAVDFALITQVLPAARDRGRDLGVLNVASALPQVIAPAVAAPVVSSPGGYPALFATAGVVSVLGSVLVGRIRSVA
jgi:MFS family permease